MDPHNMNESNMTNGVTFDENVHHVEEGGGLVTPTAASTTGTTERRTNAQGKSLSVVSKAYDREGKGFLDETEKRMRELDQSDLGHLNNSVVYDLMKESIEVHQKMATQRWLIIALACFAVVLALANMATAWVAASLVKDTSVTAAGDLTVKGNSEQRIGTTAKSDVFTFGTGVVENQSERTRRLQTFQVGGDFDWVGHTTFIRPMAQALWDSHVDSEVKLKWTCGAIGQGRQYVKRVQDGSRTDYTNPETNATHTLYTYDVYADHGNDKGGINLIPNMNANGLADSSAQLSGLTLPKRYQQIFIDCAEDLTVCTVANTNCCILSWDEVTGQSVDDCPGEKSCAACGCSCLEPGTPEFRCWSSCDVTDPFMAADKPLPMSF